MYFILCESCSLNTEIPATGPRAGQGKYLLKGISQGSLLAILRHKYALIHEQMHYVPRRYFPEDLLRNGYWKVPQAGSSSGHRRLSVGCVIYQINTYLGSSKQARIS